MPIAELRRVLNAAPFRPFVIHLADGRMFRIKQPEFMAISPTGRTAIVFEETDGHEIIDCVLMTSVEVPSDRRKSPKRKKA